MKRKQDAYGQMIHDHFLGRETVEIVERDDGWLATSGGPPNYFAEFADWPAHQRRAARFVTGRVLDVGAGAGRWSLHLQEKSHEVVAIDVSPLAVQTCRLRGVKDARVLPITQVSPALGRFDTIVMMGNNFGLFGGRRRARWLLRRLKSLTNPGARIVRGREQRPVQDQRPGPPPLPPPQPNLEARVPVHYSLPPTVSRRESRL
jgi:SAM-dependent methyltransferase